MKEIQITDKEQFFKEHFPFEDVPELFDKKRCIHCDETFFVGNYKVFVDEEGFEYICCPNAPECDGTVIDWFDVTDNFSLKTYFFL